MHRDHFRPGWCPIGGDGSRRDWRLEMKRAAIVAVAMTGVFIAGLHVWAQGGNEMTARLTASIERKMQSQEPLRLSADTITLSGDTLRLSGHAQIVSSDTKIQAN